MKINKSVVGLLLMVAAFRLALDANYAFIVSPSYSYQGFGWNPGILRYVLSWVGLFGVLLFYTSKSSFLSKKITFSLFIVGYVPLTTCFGLLGFEWLWFLQSSIFWVILALVSDFKIRVPAFKGMATLTPLVIVVGVFAFVSVFLLIWKFGFAFGLSLSDVYEVRAENKLSEIPLGGYIIPWASRIALPALGVIGIRHSGVSGKMMVLSAFVLEFLIFSLTGHKGFLFGFFVAIGLYFISDKKDVLMWMAGGCFLVVVACGVYDGLTGGALSGLLVRRVFFMPAVLSSYYYEFFDGYPMMLSHSIFSDWIVNPLGMSPSNAIGKDFFGSEVSNMNNGVVADGFMNFGFIGLVLWAVLLGIVISLFSRLARQTDQRISFVFGLNSFRAFLNGGLLTALLTHGVIFTFYLLSLLPRQIRR